VPAAYNPACHIEHSRNADTQTVSYPSLRLCSGQAQLRMTPQRVVPAAYNPACHIEHSRNADTQTVSYPSLRLCSGQAQLRMTPQRSLPAAYTKEYFDYLKREILPKLDWVRFAFTSPSGGLKIGLRFEQPLFRDADYKAVYQFIQKFADNLLGMSSDATHDSARATFFSWDPDIYDNPNARLIDTEKVLNTCIQAEVERVAESCHSCESRKDAVGTGVPPVHGHAGTHVPTKRITITAQVIQDVENCALYLSNTKIKYHDWIKVGMALYSGFGETGKKYWDMFLNNPNYSYETQKNLDAHWNHFSKVRSITLASLFYVAEQYGWINPRDSRPSLDGGPQVPAFAGTTEKVPAFAGTTELVELFGKPANVELDVLKLPDILQEYLCFTDTVTDAQLGAKLTAILPCISANIGNRVYMVNNSARIFPHIWSIIIGPSSISRKTTVIKLARQTLEPYEESLSEEKPEDYLKDTLIMTDITMSKLLSMLSENPNRLFMQMEISAWMRLMNRQWNAGMKQALTDLFDGVDKTIANMERSERIRKPAFSIIAASTEGWFFQEMKDVADQQSGFLQRFLFCLIQNVNTDEIDLTYREGQESCPELRKYEEMYSVFRSIPGHFKLALSEQAKETRNSEYKNRFESVVKLKNDTLMSYFARIYDGYFFKFCIIFHLLKHWTELKEIMGSHELTHDFIKNWFDMNPVSEETVSQAFSICDYYFENTKPFLSSLSENMKLQNERKLVNLLCRSENGTATHSLLLNRARMNKREFKEAIEILIEREAVTVTTTYNRQNNKTAKTYVLSPGLLQSWRVDI